MTSTEGPVVRYFEVDTLSPDLGDVKRSSVLQCSTAVPVPDCANAGRAPVGPL